MARKIHKLKRLTETSYKWISSLLQDSLEQLENDREEDTQDYREIEKAQKEIDANYW